MDKFLLLAFGIAAVSVFYAIRRGRRPEQVHEVLSALWLKRDLCTAQGADKEATEYGRLADALQFAQAYVFTKRNDWDWQCERAAHDVSECWSPRRLNWLGMYEGTERFQRCYAAVSRLSAQYQRHRKRPEGPPPAR